MARDTPVIPREEIDATSKLLLEIQLREQRQQALFELLSAGDAAWQDLHDWMKTARGLRERSQAARGADYDPACPHQRGIDESDRIATRLGHALEAMRQLVEAKP
jgi:hypothetical protein